MSGPLLVGVREAARELGIGRDSAYRLVREGRLRVVSIGGRQYVPRGELENFCRREADGSDRDRETAFPSHRAYMGQLQRRIEELESKRRSE